MASGRIAIGDGDARAEIAPASGGAIASFRWGEGAAAIDWLRPARDDASEAGAMGCFPLVPFSNRVRFGRFEFAGRAIRLPVDAARDPHFEHGHGWRAGWRVAEREDARLALEFAHEPDAWPWRYAARQEIRLADGALHVSLAATNLADEPMPLGLGLHPWFPRTPGCRLSAGVAAMWETDAEILPTRLAPPPSGADPRAGIAVDAVALDNVFAGWDRHARIDWPERGAALALTADAPLDFLVVYTPPGEDHFCAEPVSNATGAFNLAAAGRTDTGLVALAPGARLEIRASFTPQREDRP